VLEQYYARFTRLFRAVEEDDLKSIRPHAGHGFWDHDVLVALYAANLCRSRVLDASESLAFVAGLIHSADRKVEPELVQATLERYLDLTNFNETQRATVLEAVARHMEFRDKNVETRSWVQKALMDGDKLANMEAAVVIRSGQFHPHIAAVEPQWLGRANPPGVRYNNPTSTYPKPQSVLDDLRGCLEWAEDGWMHFDEAKDRATDLADRLQEFIKDCEEPYVKTGIADFLAMRREPASV
jgi:nicotinamide riboside kinase